MGIPGPPVAVLPDTADTRLLIELTSHANDLSEAAHALGCALTSGEDSELWMPLTSHAVTAYIRPFIHSNVRTRLDKMSVVQAIPANFQPVHDVIRNYRNTTIAHSQSTLVMPLPVAILDDRGKGVDVIGVSVTHQMPFVLAERFRDLIRAVGDIVEEATELVLDRLRTWLKEQDTAAIGTWRLPVISEALDADFTSVHRRKRTPQFTTYWRIWEPPQEPIR